MTLEIGSRTASEVGLGCNNLGRSVDVAAARELVSAAIDAGVNFFDTADRYGDGRSEEVLGAALAGRRDGVLVATKFGLAVSGVAGSGGASERWIRTAVQDSLRRLGTDRIDLYQLHSPDPDIPIAETLGALRELVDAGLVLAVGCSNLTAAQLDEALVASEAAGVAFRTVQDEYSLLRRGIETNGVAEHCVREGLSLLPFYPLASGLLTGKYSGGAPAGARLTTDRYRDQYGPADHERADELKAIASAHGCSATDLAVRWLLSRSIVGCVIAGATTPAQVTANAAAGRAAVPPEAIAAADALTAP